MKKVMILVGVLMVMVLAACSGTSSGDTAMAAPQSNGSAASTGQLSDNFEDALSVQMQLAVGVMELEGSNMAVDAEQAADLLPLWRAVQSMSASGTAAAAEITAVVNQIQATMTPDQIAAIADMQLAQAALRQLSQDGVITIEVRGDRDSGDGAPAGGQRGGTLGGGAPGGIQADPSQQATREAARGGDGNSVFDQAVTNAVVQLLETKAN